MRKSRPLLTVALALLLVLAGCSGSGGDAGMAATQADLSGGSGGDSGAEADQATGTPVDDAGAATGQRMRIKKAEFRVRVDEFGASRENLSTAVAAQGGYVSSSTVNTHERGNETFTDGRIVYRVPAENYSEFTSAVRAEGAVLSENENVDDVTRQHADLEARLKSLKAERDRLRELYDEANTTEDVLAVQRELADVQREIERAEAQLRTLENQVAYSTVTVEFREERPDYSPDRDRWYDTGVIAAFLESVDGALVALRAVVVGFAFALPYLIVFGIPVVGVVALIARFRELPGSLPVIGESAESEAESADSVDAEPEEDDT